VREGDGERARERVIEGSGLGQRSEARFVQHDRSASERVGQGRHIRAVDLEREAHVQAGKEVHVEDRRAGAPEPVVDRVQRLVGLALRDALQDEQTPRTFERFHGLNSRRPPRT
jgi:hypothetical protein